MSGRGRVSEDSPELMVCYEKIDLITAARPLPEIFLAAAAFAAAEQRPAATLPQIASVAHLAQLRSGFGFGLPLVQLY